MTVTSQNLLMRVNYTKILLLSFLAIVVGLGFAGFLLPKIIRLGMRMVKFIYFHKAIHLYLRLCLKKSATSCNTWNNDTFNVREDSISVGFQAIYIQYHQQGRSNGRSKTHTTTNWTILL